MAKAPKDKRFDSFMVGGADPWDYRGPLSDAVVVALSPPPSGNRLKFEPQGRGFAVRVTAANAKSFVLNYRTQHQRERRLTIGSFPDWTVALARSQAGVLRRQVDLGEDPMAERHVARSAPLIRQLIERFDAEHIAVRLRPGTQVMYRGYLRRYIEPALGLMPVTAVTFADIDGLHRRLLQAGKPAAADTVVGVAARLFAQAVKWGLRPDNPARGVERMQQHGRQRFLTAAELTRLTTVLDAHPGSAPANVVRLLLLTGARRGEVLQAEWNQFDLVAGVWTKPATLTKQKRVHRLPLSAPTVTLLTQLRATATDPLLFPPVVFDRYRGQGGNPLRKVLDFWEAARQQAGIPDVHLHDLRHSFASVLAASGTSLQVIGALLGHSQIATTQRYAHLLDSTLREATARAARVITGDAS